MMQAAVYDQFSSEAARGWYLDGNANGPDIDIASVWDEYTGAGVSIAVHDSAIAFHHEDLVETYNSDIDFDLSSRSADMVYPYADDYESHGTAVAGVIGAANNGTGVVGVAFGADLAGLSFDYDDPDVLDDLYYSFEHKVSDYDIVNNSWSFTEAFHDRNADSLLEHGIVDGRDGLGTVFVSSAGNARPFKLSHFNGFQGSPFAITVAAVDEDGDSSYFSSIGTNILVSAGGTQIETTTGTSGTGLVNGTSFAAPIVSGVVGLMLEANPDLGYRDVQEILAYSARVDDLGAVDDFARPKWLTNGADNFNGGGLDYNEAFGFGFVNARDAVRLAETWTKQETLADRLTLEQTYQPDAPVEMIAGERDRITFTFEVEEDMTVEHAQLSLDFDWANNLDLKMFLVSPEGTRSRLMYDVDFFSKTDGEFRDFPFTSVLFMGEEARGTWTVEIANPHKDAGLKSTFREATLTLHGEAPDADDTYVYTDEFATRYDESELATRLTLDDADGGTDTINAAAITASSHVDLSAGRAILAGQTVSVAGIENVFTGDGDDVLTGDGADNWLRGGRGDDLFVVSGGHDEIDGGPGTDVVDIASSLDAILSFSLDGDRLSLVFDTVTSAVLDAVEVVRAGGVDYTIDALLRALEGGTADDPADTPDTGTGGGDAPADAPDGGTDGGDAPVDDAPVDDAPGEETDGGSDPLPAPGTGIDAIVGERPADAITGTPDDEKRLKGSRDCDWVEGLAGADQLIGYTGNDTLVGGDGADTLNGMDGDDVLYGGTGDNVLVGNEGADVLVSGAGDDVMRGGAGADRYVFDASSLGSSNVIRGFLASDGDVIDLSALFDLDENATFSTRQDGGRFVIDARVNGDSYEIAEIISDFNTAPPADTLVDLGLILT